MPEPIVIELPLFEMWNQKVIKTYYSRIELYDHYYQLKHEYKMSEMVDKDDPSRGWEDGMACYDTKIYRQCCAGVDLSYVPKTIGGKNPLAYWIIQILNFDGSHINKLYIESNEKAKQAYETIWNWVYNR